MGGMQIFPRVCRILHPDKRPDVGCQAEPHRPGRSVCFMTVLLVKVTLMPLVIGLITLSSRKWGHRIGGMVASLPWVAGPILLFFILEQGKTFGIRSVQGILMGIVSWTTFCYSYALLSRRFHWLPTVLISYGVYVAIAWVFTFFTLNLFATYGIALGCALLALRLFPKPAAQTIQPRRLPFDVPIRMVVATLFVVVVTWLANVLGPAWSGILTPFPIITSILAIFTHYLQGSTATILILRGLLIGVLGFTTFFFLQAFLLPHFSVGASFCLALVVNLLINIVSLRLVN